MPESGTVTRFALPMFFIFGLLGAAVLAMAHGRLFEVSFNPKPLVHVGTAFTLLAGVMLMWKVEHQK